MGRAEIPNKQAPIMLHLYIVITALGLCFYGTPVCANMYNTVSICARYTFSFALFLVCLLCPILICLFLFYIVIFYCNYFLISP